MRSEGRGNIYIYVVVFVRSGIVVVVVGRVKRFFCVFIYSWTGVVGVLGGVFKILSCTASVMLAGA